MHFVTALLCPVSFSDLSLQDVQLENFLLMKQDVPLEEAKGDIRCFHGIKTQGTLKELMNICEHQLAAVHDCFSSLLDCIR